MAAQVTVQFQPFMDLHTERVVGAEALMRLDGSPPTEAELKHRTGRIEDAADLSAEVCRQSLDLIGALPRDSDWFVTINVPPEILGTELLRERVPFEDYSPDILRRFVIEVSERERLHDKAWEAVSEARELGIRLAMDDFGMGSSNLARLLDIDFDFLKIDKTFVDRLAPAPTEERRRPRRVNEERRHAEKVIRAIATMARMLDTRSTAEGIEHREQAAILRAVGVDWGQGWLWHEAMPREDFLALAAADPDNRP